MIMRGGSSKGAYFLANDLPTNTKQRDQVLLSIMGSPDPRQIDGIGGAHPLTSKVAIVSLAEDEAADLEYLFLQVSVDNASVSNRQNCGNLLAGVGPFAVERGLLAPAGDHASVRIRMLNTASIATATFGITNRLPIYNGDTKISGVPGNGSPILLDFEDLAGSSCGSLLPSGSLIEEIEGVAATLIDNGMPVVVMRADAFDLTGQESCAELESNSELRKRIEAIRLVAGKRMGLGDVTEATVPKLTLVAPPKHGGDISTRTFIPHRCHQAIGALGAISVATAALLPGSTAATVLAQGKSSSVILEHLTGSFEALVEIENSSSTPTVKRTGIVRTARKLMDGIVFTRNEQ